ncbi:MAG: HupE/UreJ family protein [Pseudomonadota bacterium]
MRKTLAAVFALCATPAFAHHPLSGAKMETFAHGVLSGIGHPVLGFDHLFFVIAIGIAAVYTGRALQAPLGYVAGMLGGVSLIVGGVPLPAVELLIAFSLLTVGVILMSGRAIGFAMALGLFGLLGLFHGWAFGESLVGQEGGASAGVVAGYLIGIAVTQWVIAVAAGFAIMRLWGALSAEAVPARLAGGLVAGVGGFLVLESAEAAVFSALGLG